MRKMPDTPVTLGSLFDGIGVFPLAASRHGITPVFASEIEKAPISITKRHFPGMAHLGDITAIDGRKIPVCDVLTFGSPCQNLSLAGLRTGLAGAQSGLFHEATRIIQEMREATNGIYPAFAVWENVMGAFSSNDRMDFRAVLQSFTGTEVPMPVTGRWANAGMVRGYQPDIVWRVLDAQYWGVPQRRNRIFLVADYRGQRAAQILFRPDALFKDSSPVTASRVQSAPGNRISSNEAGRKIPVIYPFQERKMRGAARECDAKGFLASFGKPTDPFPTLLASEPSIFACWQGSAYHNGFIRCLTPIECERLMGLPEGWTAFGYDGNPISDAARCKALGNSIVLPCAEYIMSGISELLKGV